MLANTGTVSFVLYAIFITISLLGLATAIYFIKRDTIAAERLDKIIDLCKYTIVSVALTTIALMVTDLFKEREQDVKELEYFDKYVQDVKKVDGVQERFQLSKYLAIVAPSGELKRSWREYYDSLSVEYREYVAQKKQEKILDTVSNPTEEQLFTKQLLQEEIKKKEAPLVATYSNIKPRVYIQISNEAQRADAAKLQTVLINDNFSAPGIENVGKKPNILLPIQTEVRYTREEDLADALRLIAIVKSQSAGTVVNDTPKKISSSNTRPGHFEVWYSK